jgi:uncharacterized membrane protein
MPSIAGMPAQEIALAYALTATTGLRAALTLLAIAVAAHVGWIDLSPRMAWLGSPVSLGVLAVLAMLDFIGDKVPAVDNAMHGVQTFFKPVAGAIAAAAVVPGADDPAGVALMVLGGGNALAIHGLDATTRVASTAFTGGIMNPFLSALGDLSAVGGIVLAFFAPVAAAAIVLALTLIMVRLAIGVLRRRRTTTELRS